MPWYIFILSCLLSYTAGGKLLFKPAQKEENVICLDKHTKCPRGTLCCITLDGQYECCPSQVRDFKLFLKPGRGRKVICNCKSAKCSDGNTCCPMKNGHCGCCPFLNAVCCSDYTHCCPSGSLCEVSHGLCYKKNVKMPWMEKTPAKSFTVLEEHNVLEKSLVHENPHCVVCPDGRSQCPDGTTCCIMPGGTYGCCPLPDAVCCSDGVHCCPHLTTCDVSQGRCIKQDGTSYPWLPKSAAIATKPENVQCDPEYSCPSGDTCCKLKTGQWGCCPLPKAVCCSDGVHCCPHLTTCDVSQGRCIKQDGTSYPWLHKRTAIVTKSENVQCDPEYSCPSGDTCCKLKTGQWGCCPLPKAVCCSDGVHCCPHLTTCDVSQGRCIKQDGTSYPWLPKTTAIITKSENVQCDPEYSCPSGDTCCKLKTGQWGCCPLPKAVCCSDGVHCCPHLTTCDVSQGRCIKQDGTSYNWLMNTKSVFKQVKVISIGAVTSIRCPDGKFECPDGSTCCKEMSGQYGCCPLEKAVCCSDGLHCCPHGTACDVSAGKCVKDLKKHPWFEREKTFLSTILQVKTEMIVCPNFKHCPDEFTCCPIGLHQFGCCPLPNATCCADMTHCCPQNSICNFSTGNCVRSVNIIPFELGQLP